MGNIVTGDDVQTQVLIFDTWDGELDYRAWKIFNEILGVKRQCQIQVFPTITKCASFKLAKVPNMF